MKVTITWFAWERYRGILPDCWVCRESFTFIEITPMRIWSVKNKRRKKEDIPEKDNIFIKLAWKRCMAH